jgi:hypothetical protein
MGVVAIGSPFPVPVFRVAGTHPEEIFEEYDEGEMSQWL